MNDRQKRRKVLVVHPIPVWGGASVALLTVLEALRLTNRFEFVILLSNQGASFKEFSRQGYECIVVPFPAIGTAGGGAVSYYRVGRFVIDLILASPRLAAFLRRRKFDCAYLNTGVCLGPAILCRIFRLPVVWHIRELLDNKTVFGRFLCSRIAGLSVAVIANSRSSASVIPATGRLQIIYDGVPESFAEAVSSEKIAMIRKEWGFAAGSVVFGLISAISWSKGHSVLLRALSSAVKDYSQIRVVFIGGTVTPTDYHMNLRARVKRLMGRFSDAEEYLRGQVRELNLEDFVVFDGWRGGRELVERIAACDVIAFPSTIPEGFGRPVVEGALVGKPTIGTDAGALPELIRDGYSGWLVPMNDVDRLAGCLVAAARDPNATRVMGLRARDIAMREFTSAIHDRKVQELFETVCCDVRQGEMSP